MHSLGCRKKHEILINTLGTPEELPFDDKWLPQKLHHNFIAIALEVPLKLNCNHSYSVLISMNFQCKTRVAMGDPYINSNCDEIFRAIICSQKATFQVLPEYLLKFRIFCATLMYTYSTSICN